MLAELTISNFAIIDQVHLQLAPGFNVLTGETGAGKSIIIDALSQLLGSRADTTFIRAGADRARIEGVFVLSPTQQQALRPLLEEHGLIDEDEPGDTLILTRELHQTGRTTARINGRAVTVTLLRAIGEKLVDIHGQSEHLSLIRVREHVDLLDRYAGLETERAALREKIAALRRIRRELEHLRQNERELARRADLLAFQVQEIADARLQPGEEETLLTERNRLANAEKLIIDASAAYDALYHGTDETPSIIDLLGEVTRALHHLARIDPSINSLSEQADALSYVVEDLARGVRDYRDEIEYNPGRQEEVEERLELISNLKRKYGDTIEEILAFGERAAEELEQITHSEERIERLEKQEAQLLQEIAVLATDLSDKRRAAASRLSTTIEQALAELHMAATQFAVDFKRVEDEQGIPIDGTRYAFDETGVDRVEFLISPNPGEPLRPLAKIASGGETARLMLALKSTLSAADATPTLIFDEIDVGIGGRIGEVVGRKLWGLTAGGTLEHQVICVTHLPQVAVFGDAHYQIVKSVGKDRTSTQVIPLDPEARIEELSQMLGSVTDATREAAREMLMSVQTWKASFDSSQPVSARQSTRKQAKVVKTLQENPSS